MRVKCAPITFVKPIPASCLPSVCQLRFTVHSSTTTCQRRFLRRQNSQAVQLWKSAARIQLGNV
uniref:Uncharacterized protein n=1 Tax=Anguilla anguilla TaxID=7936 RepID=A0A0E9V3J3_ANGAN